MCCKWKGRLSLKLANNNVVQVYPVSFPNEDGSLTTVLPFTPAYALTISKGQILDECIVWLDGSVVAAGGAYVTLSHCRKLENVHFMTCVVSSQVTLCHFCRELIGTICNKKTTLDNTYIHNKLSISIEVLWCIGFHINIEITYDLK